MAQKAYRIRNWRKYNEALVKRGSITFWFSEECISHWTNTERNGKRGRPEKYTDLVIECGLMLKALFSLTFRSTEGFIGSLIELMQLKLAIPDYSLLCKRFVNKEELNGNAVLVIIDEVWQKQLCFALRLY
jgi:hypothetical protein